YIGIEGFAKGFRSKSRYSENASILSTLAAPFPFNGPNNLNLRMSETSRLRTAELGADLRPGFLVTSETLLYGRMGFGINRSTLVSHTGFAVNNTFLNIPLKSQNDNLM